LFFGIKRAKRLNIARTSYGYRRTITKLTSYKYLYRDKIVRDSILINDTIRVPYPVETVKEVKKPLSGRQNFQVWCGRIALAIILLTIIYFCRKLTIFAQK